jgi:hypothetical protein
MRLNILQRSQRVFLSTLVPVVFLVALSGHLKAQDVTGIPYVHSTVRAPFPDGVNLAVPPELGDQRSAGLGLVDVTKAPFNADATGEADATAALQRAIEFARDHQMVCFFPPGTYRVSDTLSCIQQRYWRSNGKILDAHLFPCVLVGSRVGQARPRILLAPRSAGFGDAMKPKFVIHFWARGYKNPTKPGLADAVDPEHEQPNISMNQMLVNLDVVIGEGNAGAIGVRHQAAEGSAIEDCTIDATHGFAGIQGGIGSGGGSAGVTIIGGRIGLDFTGKLSGTQPTPTITGFTLIGQTEAAIRSTSRQTLVAAGLKIVADKCAGPLIDVPAGERANVGQLSLVDSEIVFDAAALAKPERVVVGSGSGVYLNNVLVRGATQVVVDAAQRATLPGNPNGWLRVREYAHTAALRLNQKVEYRYPVYVDGQRVEEVRALAPNETPPADLQARHLWASNFPSWESSGVANVKAAPYNARGDGRADDTDALQHAVNEHEIVFLPKGYYRISRTIELKPHTKLIGVGQHLSIIVAAKAEGDFSDPAHPAPLVRTADAAEAATVLAFCGLYAATDMPAVYALHWRCGCRSVFRAVEINEVPIRGFTPRKKGELQAAERNHPLVVISGHGGGRWYNFRAESAYNQGKDYRHLLAQESTGELNFYQFSPQHAVSEIATEFRGARHVSVFGAKYEGNEPMMVFRDCDDVRLFGHGGNGSGRVGGALYVFERTPNFLFANGVEGPTRIGAQTPKGFNQVTNDPREWHMLIERPAACAEIKLPPLERPVLYRRGYPR